MSQVCDEIFINVHKLLRMCIVLKALHTINACFSGKHASRTCRFNHSSCISKNRPFSETKHFAAFHFASHSFVQNRSVLLPTSLSVNTTIEKSFTNISA